MAQSLSHLHDPHNGSIDLILSILEDPFCSAGLLLHLYGGISFNYYPTLWQGHKMGKYESHHSITVSFIWIWFILIRKSLCLNSSLQENLSPSSTSLLFGILVRTRAFPHASDCKVRRSSLSSVKQSCFILVVLTNENVTNLVSSLKINADMIIHTYSCCQFYLLKGELLSFIKHQQHKCLEKWHLQLFLALVWRNQRGQASFSIFDWANKRQEHSAKLDIDLFKFSF